MIRGPFSMPWWTASGSGRWIRGGWHIQSLNLFAVHFNRTLVLASGRRQRVSHLCRNVLWFGQAEGNWKQQGVFCLGSPRCSFPTSASWSDSGPRLKLVVLVWTIFVNRHCGQGVSFGAALPPLCLASECNRCSGATWALWNDRLLRELHWGECSEGYSLQKVSFPRFFPSGKIGDSCRGAAQIGKHAPGLHNRRKQVPDGARSVSHCLALQWAIVQPSLESLFVLEWLLSDCFHQTTHAPPWTPTGPPRSENHSCRESRRGWEVKWNTDMNLCSVYQGLKWDVRNLWLWPCSVLNE